jgi:CTP:molybdopterin cytidylyltransferase MocA
MKYKNEVENLSPDIGLRGTVYSHPEDILEVDVDTPNILQDIDDEADYKRELKKKK